MQVPVTMSDIMQWPYTYLFGRVVRVRRCECVCVREDLTFRFGMMLIEMFLWFGIDFVFCVYFYDRLFEVDLV